MTLGFRGEALAAIASVSHMRIISKTRDSDVGAMLEADSGDILSISERACSDGTTVIVEDLFANVPARRKFLKKDVTESMAVVGVVEKIALSKPDIAFKLIVDGMVKIETMGDGNLKNTIYSIFGKDFASRLIQTEIDIDGIVVKGFVGRSDNVRSNRNYQNFFINGRYVKSKTACAAIEQAYTSYIPPEKCPCCILFLTINPSAVDVNVHPAKLEVKFSNEKPVFDAVFYSVKNALESNTARPSFSFAQPKKQETVQSSSWIGRSVSERQLPIEEGKRESIKSRQIASDIYVTAPQNNTTAEAVLSKAPQKAEKEEDELVVPPDATFEETCEIYLKYICSGKSNASADEEDELEWSENMVADTPTLNVEAEAPKETAFPMIPSEEKESKEEIEAKEEKSEEKPRDIAVNDAPAQEHSYLLEYKIVGEVFNSYVIVERGDKMLMIDKHAAHERIIFENLKQAMKQAACTSQMLMLPLEVMLTSEEIQAISDYKKEIEAVGFEFTNGRYTVNVTAVPEGISLDAVPDMLAAIAERIKSNTGSAKLTRDIIFEKALYQASCKAAIKAGREYPKEHIQWLVKKLMELPDITVCPHGRPVAMELSKKELDKQFERT